MLPMFVVGSLSEEHLGGVSHGCDLPAWGCDFEGGGTVCPLVQVSTSSLTTVGYPRAPGRRLTRGISWTSPWYI